MMHTRYFDLRDTKGQQKIIEDHGGYIWATSKEGEGTCLHFVIRKYREAEADE